LIFLFICQIALNYAQLMILSSGLRHLLMAFWLWRCDAGDVSGNYNQGLIPVAGKHYSNRPVPSKKESMIQQKQEDMSVVITVA
jgi:hypothetical protein